MLVIRRREGEAVLIGAGVEIEVLDAANGRVTLGIKAPAEIPVLRKEVWLTRLANQAAAREPDNRDLTLLAARLRTTLPSG